jgi:hypothetical protein
LADYWAAPGNTSPSLRRDSARLNRCAVLLFAELANRSELRGEQRDLAFDGRDLLLVGCAAPCVLRALERFGSLRFVEIGAADRGIGQNGDDLGLYLQDAAGDEDQLLLAPAGMIRTAPGLMRVMSGVWRG